MIDELTIQKVKDAANIVDVIGDFYELHKRGLEYDCLCPFHDDRHLGSFKISPRKNIAKCFSCGWQGGPVNFLMEHEHLSFADAIRWLGKKYSIEVEGADTFNVKPATPRAKMPPLPMLTLPAGMVLNRMDLHTDTLTAWLRSHNWDNAQLARIDDVLKDYYICHSKNGMTIFWQIDEHSNIRTGKMMRYLPDGHRDKSDGYNFDWIHSALYRDYRTGYSADKTDVKQCLFGLHLMNKYKMPNIQQDVCIVESEKTAVIMAIAHGNTCKQIWMACGGLANISREKLMPLIRQNRNIILYPDRDGIKKWKEKAAELEYDRIMVDTKPVTEWWKPEDGEKADIADVFLRMIDGRKVYQNISEVVEDFPKIKKLHDNLNLTITDQ